MIIMRCPKCNTTMEKVKWDVGFGVLVSSFHCPKCKFNLTDEKGVNRAIIKLRKRMTFERKIVRIGTGFGLRFPNELVEEYKIGRGKLVKIFPEKERIIVKVKN